MKGFNEISNGRNPDIFSIGGYDGMHLIYETLKKTGGKADGDSLIAAAKGMKWESPRGPVQIDPETRDIILTVYIDKVDEDAGRPAQRRDRQGRERQGPGQGADDEIGAAAALRMTRAPIDGKSSAGARFDRVRPLQYARRRGI